MANNTKIATGEPNPKRQKIFHAILNQDSYLYGVIPEEILVEYDAPYKVTEKNRMLRIKKNYRTFETMANKTENEWYTFFKAVSKNYSDPLVCKLVNENPVLALDYDLDFLACIECNTLPICAAVCRAAKKRNTFLSNYREIRALINASAESQLEAIKLEIFDSLIVDHYRQIQLMNENNCPVVDWNCDKLYDPFKSPECIYEWIKKGRYLSLLPAPFDTPEIVLEVVRLGNSKVFENYPQQDEKLCMSVLEINPNFISRIREQTAKMRDYVLSKSMNLIEHIHNSLIDTRKKFFFLNI